VTIVSVQGTPAGTPAAVRFGRRPARGVLLGLSVPRAVALGTYVCAGIIALAAGGVAGLAVTVLAGSPLLAAALVRAGGLTAADWAPVAAHYAARKAAGQTRFLARHPAAPRPAGTLALPGDAAALRWHVDGPSGAVMIHDPHRRTLAGIVPVSYPAFALLDDGQRAGRVAQWGRVLAQLAASGHCAALQVCEATVPDPGAGQRDWWAAHGRHDRSWAAAQYEDLLARVRLDAAVHRTTITYTLDLRAAARAVRAAGGGLAGAAVVLRAELAGLADSLGGAGLRAGPPLGEADLAVIIRQAYDPAAAVDTSSPGAALRHAGPLAMAEGWDRLRHDSGWSRVLWVSEWPRITVPPDFLHPLLFVPGLRRVVSVTARPAGTADALRAIRKQKTEAAADAAHKARVGQVADLADTAAWEDLLARERAVIAGHADAAFTGLVTVTAASPDELDAGTAALARAAAQGACELRPLYGRQAQGLVCGALPLGRRPF
jgi:hypothetical protein